MSLSYDSAIIVRFADRLYRQASRIVFLYAVVGAVIGLAFGVALDARANTGTSVTAIGGLLLAAIGYVIGTERAFSLRLQAQTALCQVQIETNTRTAGVADGGKLPRSLAGSANAGV